jgi:hypothetical protein
LVPALVVEVDSHGEQVVPMRRTTAAVAAGIARWRARGSSFGMTWAVPVRHQRPILIRTLGSAWMLRT